MKNKNKFLGLLVVFMLMLFSSCGSSFLDSEPTDKISETSVGETVDNLYFAINGTHRAMYRQYYSTSNMAGEHGMIIARDAMAEDLVWANRSNGWFMYEASWDAHRSDVSLFLQWIYIYHYKLILNANLVLANVDDAEPSTGKMKREYVKGEALMFRAHNHFNLVQLYGKRYQEGGNNTQLGVPYRLEPNYEPMARNTVEEVYELIHKDLDEAITLLEGYKAKGVNHFTQKVALGVKARVLLAQHRYAEAAEFATKAIAVAEKDGHKLQEGEGLLTGFNSTTSNSEWLWANIMENDQTIYFHSFFSFMSWNFNSGNIRNGARLINNTLYDKMSQTDIRRQWWDPTGELKGPEPRYALSKYQTRKFTSKSTASTVNDLPYMRLAELYLMASEAYARAGKESEAQTVFTKYMKTRDAEYAAATNSGEAFLEEVLINRRVELWGEGFRFTDLKRMNLPLDRKGANHKESVCRIMEVPVGDVKWQFLIPKIELDTGDGLVVQNEV